MIKNPKLLLVLGLILIALSAVLYWKSTSPDISSTDQARCEQIVQQKYNNNVRDPSLLSMCKESVGYVAQVNAEADGATSAEEMVKAISSANRRDLGVTMLFMFFLGLLLILGVVFTIRGIQGLMTRN